MTDRRTRAWRELEILDVIASTGGVSPIWLAANRTRFAALRRLGESGRIRALDDTSPEFRRFEVVAKPWWQRLKEWLVGGPSL